MKRAACLVLGVLVAACGSPLGREPACRSREIAVETDLEFLMGGDPVCLVRGRNKLACANSITLTPGAPDEDRTIPEHRVRLDAYFVDQTEVTNLQYRECVDQGVCGPPGDCVPLAPWVSRLYGCRYARSEYDDLPVVAVTWDNARKYCAWSGKRLPTEAEWERAAVGPRAADAAARMFPWGDPQGTTAPGDDQAFIIPDRQCLSILDTAPKAVHGDTRARGQSAEGIYDLTGNVREWTADDYDPAFYCAAATSSETRPLRPNDCGGPSFQECQRSAAVRLGSVAENPRVDTGGSRKVVRGGAFCPTAKSGTGHFCDLTTRSRIGLEQDLVGDDTPSAAPFLSGMFNEAQLTGFRCARTAGTPAPPRDNLCPLLPVEPVPYVPPASWPVSSSFGAPPGSSAPGSSSGTATSSSG